MKNILVFSGPPPVGQLQGSPQPMPSGGRDFLKVNRQCKDREYTPSLVG